ncbi:MAG TPA: PadR family transcriptional regulator [Thermoanaerobaculia bacterium]
MSLPHVLLGLLHGTPRTGYDLARALADEVDPAWSAGFSQIYPALARLRRRGWVLLRVLGPRHGPRRNLYRVTAAGRRELARWLAETPPVPRRNDEALVRIALLDAVPAADRRRALAAAESALAAEVARLRSLPLPGGYRSLARRGAIERHEAMRRFLRTGGAAPLTPSETPAGRRTARKKR